MKEDLENKLTPTDPELIRLKDFYRLDRLPIKVTVEKDEEEKTSATDTHYSCFLRHPSLKELNMYTRMVSEGDIISAMEEMMVRQWLTGDEIMKTDASIVASMQEVFMNFAKKKVVDIKKK